MEIEKVPVHKFPPKSFLHDSEIRSIPLEEQMAYPIFCKGTYLSCVVLNHIKN